MTIHDFHARCAQDAKTQRRREEVEVVMPAFPATLPCPFSLFVFLCVFVSLRESVWEIHARCAQDAKTQRGREEVEVVMPAFPASQPCPFFPLCLPLRLCFFA
jgi:hypothetical protein